MIVLHLVLLALLLLVGLSPGSWGYYTDSSDPPSSSVSVDSVRSRYSYDGTVSVTRDSGHNSIDSKLESTINSRDNSERSNENYDHRILKLTAASMLGSEASLIELDKIKKKKPRNGGVSNTSSAVTNSSSSGVGRRASNNTSIQANQSFNNANVLTGNLRSTGDSKMNVVPILTSSVSVEVTKEKLFYMYDLPEEFWWRWPKPGTECTEHGYLGHEHAELSGIGPPIKPEDGLFLTWHFSLFSSLYNRMKRSSRRTYDPEKASLFIIPYDIGLDGYMDANTCRNRRQCSHGFIGKLQKILSESKYFKRHEGADHAVLWSLGQYHPWPRAGCDMFMRNFCGLCTFTCYWMDPTKKDNRFVSVPFPSGYHYWDGIKNLPWDLSLASQRNMTAVYLGSIQTLNPAHTKIRRAMTTQCNASSECHWLQIGHSSIDTSIADFLSVYKRSMFCLCPPGDDPARKAVSDAIVSGCIPVIFEVATLYNQYPWHIGEQDALDISVNIPGGLIRSGKLDFMSVLLAISPEVIKKKQRALARVAPRVQYAIPPIENLKNRSDTTTWDPPFKDGVELTIDGLIDRATRVLNNQSTNIPPRLLTGREWSQEYDRVRVQVPKDVDLSALHPSILGTMANSTDLFSSAVNSISTVNVLGGSANSTETSNIASSLAEIQHLEDAANLEKNKSSTKKKKQALSPTGKHLRINNINGKSDIDSIIKSISTADDDQNGAKGRKNRVPRLEAPGDAENREIIG